MSEKVRGRFLRLNTHQNARKSMARLIRLYDKDEISDTKFRNLCYALSRLLEYFRFEKDLEVEERLDKLEQYVEKAKKCGS